MIDSLPALTFCFTEEHPQGCRSHTLRTLLLPFVGTEKGNTHINSWVLMKDLKMCARRSTNTLSHTRAWDNEYRKQLPEPSVAPFFYFW